MFKKFLIGLVLVAVVCALARGGYEYGRHLAQQEKAEAATAAAQP